MQPATTTCFHFCLILGRFRDYLRRAIKTQDRCSMVSIRTLLFRGLPLADDATLKLRRGRGLATSLEESQSLVLEGALHLLLGTADLRTGVEVYSTTKHQDN